MMLRAIPLAALAFLAGAAMSAEAREACRANGARYILDGAPKIRAHFRGAGEERTINSDLIFEVFTEQRSYLFRMHVSQGYGSTTLEAVAHPAHAPGYKYVPIARGDDDAAPISFHGFDAKMKRYADPPREGTEAPHFIFAPELGPRLWYDPKSLTDDAKAERDPIPQGIFRRVGCGGALRR